MNPTRHNYLFNFTDGKSERLKLLRTHQKGQKAIALAQKDDLAIEVLKEFKPIKVKRIKAKWSAGFHNFSLKEIQ